MQGRNYQSINHNEKGNKTMDKDLSMIREIFNDYNNRHGKELPETEKASDDLNKYIDTIGLPKQQEEQLQDLIMAVACENERQGFYHGFSAGLQLASEVSSLYRNN